VTDGAQEVAAVVLGGEVTGLAVLRALGRAGIPVLATADSDLVEASRFYRPLPAPAPASTDVDGVEAYFRALPLRQAVVFPCSDSWARAVSGFSSELAERFPSVSAPLQIARALREQIDWNALRRRTAASPYAKAFFVLVEELGITPQAAGDEASGRSRVRVLEPPRAATPSR